MSDHLDRETSVSAEITVSGVRANSRSRFVAAVDRFGGNLVELVNAPMERRIARQRTIAASEAELIAAVTKFGIERLHSDPYFAERVAERHFTRVFEKQRNKDAVLREALEDLRHDQNNEAEIGGPIDTQFLDRLEHYAEGASSEQLRQKWGRVLSGEIKRPGSFSAKAMRIVDELDGTTARLFESLCTQVFRNVAAKCLTGDLPFGDRKRLVLAGLIIDQGDLGHVSKFEEVATEQGRNLWLLNLGNRRSVSIPKNTELPHDMTEPAPIQAHKSSVAVPVYVLTEVGEAISSIFSPNDAPARYVQKLRESLPNIEVVEYYQQPDGRSIPIAKLTNQPTQE